MTRVKGWLRVQVRSSDGKAVLDRRKDDGKITRLATSGTALSLTAGTWYTAKVVVDDDPNNAALQRLRFWVDTDGDGDWSDETTLIDTTQVDDDWSAGYVGLWKGSGSTTVLQFDDVKLGFDNNADGDISDAGDDVLVDDDFDSNQTSLSYDDNGNLTADGVYNYVYDAWNRLRKAQLVVSSDTTTIGAYEYFGDTRRSKKTVTNHGPEVVENDGGNTTVCFYYCGMGGPGVSPGSRWSICETRNGSNQTTFQYLWGTQYTDELIWIEVNGDPTAANDTNPDNTAEGEASEDPADMRYFVHQDRNWNVIALTEYDPNDTNNGRIAERYSYTPYGCFVVSSGDSGSGEFSSVSLTSTVGNPFTHQGLTFDQEKGSCQNRFREYSAQLHRFSERDPLGLRAGFGLYHYLDARPTFSKDPLGLLATCCSSWPTQADAEAGVDQGELCRDTWYGGLLHPGQNCYREAYACSAGACQVCYDQDDGECHASWDNYGPACGIDEDGYCEYGWGGPVWDHLLGDVLIPAWIRWRIGTIPPWFVTIPPWFVP